MYFDVKLWVEAPIKNRKHEYPYLVHLSYGKSNTTTMVKEPVSE